VNLFVDVLNVAIRTVRVTKYCMTLVFKAYEVYLSTLIILGKFIWVKFLRFWLCFILFCIVCVLLQVPNCMCATMKDGSNCLKI